MTVTFQVGDREFGGAGNLEIDFWVLALPATFRCWRIESALQHTALGNTIQSTTSSLVQLHSLLLYMIYPPHTPVPSRQNLC